MFGSTKKSQTSKPKSRKGSPASANEWGLMDEGPRQELIEATPRPWWRKMFFAYSWFAIAAMPLVAISLFLMVTNLGTMNRALLEATSTQQLQASSPGRAAATIAVQQWLAQPNPPLPGGTILSWDGAKDVAPTIVKRADGTNSEPTFKVEVNTFTVVSKGQTYTVSEQVHLDPRGGAIAVGGPALMSNTPVMSDGWEKTETWPGLPESNGLVTDSVKNSISGWANAFASGDANKLAVAVGDPDTSKSFVPLPAASTIATPTVAALKNANDPSVILVQTTLTFNATDPNQQASIPTTYDLLVERANTASPIVVAWGAPGTGPSLVRYGNAIDSRDISSSAAPSAAPSTAPSTTPSKTTTKGKK